MLNSFQNPTGGALATSLTRKNNEPAFGIKNPNNTSVTTNVAGTPVTFGSQDLKNINSGAAPSQSLADSIRAALGMSTTAQHDPNKNAPPSFTNPVGTLNAINTTGVNSSPNNNAAMGGNINFTNRPNTKLNLSDIIKEPDANKRNQLLEAYYDETLRANGVNNPGMAGLNPLRPNPTLQQAISGNLASYTDPITGKLTSLTNYSNPIAGYVHAPGSNGPGVGVGLNALFGNNDYGQKIGGGIPGFNGLYTDLGPLGQLMTGIQQNPILGLMGGGITPNFNFDVGGNANFDGNNALLQLLSGGSNFGGLLGGLDPKMLELFASLGLFGGQ